MQNHQGTIDGQNQPKISQADKLLFCSFLAIAFHAMVLFGIGFKLPDPSKSEYDKSFNVVLAQFEADKKPEKADFKGQANQEGGGESEQLLAPSATEMAQFNDPDQVSQEPQRKQSNAATAKTSPDIIAASGIDSSLKSTKIAEQETSENIPDAASLIDRSYQLSGLIANLDDENINQARKARKRAISASVHRSSDALYLDSWRRKIERVGNLNYPEKAKQEQIFGNLTLKVSVNRDGTINQLAIVKSSGEKLLDDAALRIVRLAAPFQPLTAAMSKDTDILEIIRVWRFQPNNQLKTN